jgi:hypothetical protein
MRDCCFAVHCDPQIRALDRSTGSGEGFCPSTYGDCQIVLKNKGPL